MHTFLSLPLVDAHKTLLNIQSGQKYDTSKYRWFIMSGPIQNQWQINHAVNLSRSLHLCQRPSILTGKKSCYQSDLMGERGVKMAFLSITWDGTRSITPPSLCFCVCVCQERDEERRRQLRERARQLIAEARSGVKMAELPLYTDSTSIACSAAGNNLKGRSKTAGGECRGAFIGRTRTYTHNA